MEFSNADDANLAIRMMDGYPFDKRHKFAVNKFTDIEKLANLDEKYEEPAEEEYKDRVSVGCFNPPVPTLPDSHDSAHRNISDRG